LISFWTKGFSIPAEFISYFPLCPPGLNNNDLDSAIDTKRKELDGATKKIVKKLKVPTAPATSFAKGSIASFFAPVQKIDSTKALPAPTKTTTNLLLDWHKKEDKLAPESESEKAKDNIEQPDTDAESEGEILEEEIQPDDAGGMDELSTPVRGKERPPLLQSGHVVLSLSGNKATTGPAPSAFTPFKAAAIDLEVEQPPRCEPDLPSPGPDCCCICGQALRHCKQRYKGVNVRSSNAALYSFPWRKNSCAIDACGACLQMTWLNLSKEGQRVFNINYGDFGSIFQMLSDGELDTWSAKKELETVLGKRIWSNQQLYARLRSHVYIETKLGTMLYTTVSSNHPPAPVDMGEVRPVFHASFRSVVSCLECGPMHSEMSTECIIHANLSQDFNGNWQNASLDATVGLCVSRKCKQCGANLNRTYDTFTTPLILHVMFDAMPAHLRNKNVKDVPDILRFGDASYVLSACSYGDGSHFVSLVRNFEDDHLYFCDGMENNAQYIRQTIISFPANLKSKQANTAYYIHAEFVSEDYTS
jgi:hypothetical protein